MSRMAAACHSKSQVLKPWQLCITCLTVATEHFCWIPFILRCQIPGWLNSTLPRCRPIALLYAQRQQTYLLRRLLSLSNCVLIAILTLGWLSSLNWYLITRALPAVSPLIWSTKSVGQKNLFPYHYYYHLIDLNIVRMLPQVCDTPIGLLCFKLSLSQMPLSDYSLQTITNLPFWFKFAAFYHAHFLLKCLKILLNSFSCCQCFILQVITCLWRHLRQVVLLIERRLFWVFVLSYTWWER